MKNNGKITERWLKVRAAFLRANPPNHAGYYICTYCRRWIPANEITVDHIIARSKAPQLRFEPSNLTVACGSCNARKGSSRVKSLPPMVEEPDELESLW